MARPVAGTHPRSYNTPFTTRRGIAMGIQHAKKEQRTANKKRRKARKHVLRSTKKGKR